MVAIKNTMNMFFLSASILMVLLGSNIITIKGELACSGFLNTVLPCKDFIVGTANQPSGECCVNLQGLDNQAKGSVDDRRTICQCFKAGLKLFPADPQRLKQLSQICQLSPALPTDPDVDCNSL